MCGGNRRRGGMSRISTALQVGRTFGARAGMLRLGYELQRGTGLMQRRMRSAEGWPRWSLPRIAPGLSAEDFLSSRKQGKVPFFFNGAHTLQRSSKEILGSKGEENLLAEANGILDGSLPFFGRLTYACGFPPNWFRNPVTDQKVSPQQAWTRMRFASADYGDLKFILEPSRFLFVYPLARAYAVSGDEKYAEAFWSTLEDWASQNPPASGPLWICGQECSLRILAWSFGFYSFLHSPATTPGRAALLLSIIAAHAWRTAQSLSYARSQRSNHLITEAVGLWTAGTLYPELKAAKVWQPAGARFLREAVLDQITPEGVSQQHSFNYQRMILQLLLWALRLSEVTGVPLDNRVRERATSAFDFIRSVTDPTSGRAPNYGSNDGSLIFPLSACDYGDFRPVLQLGAAVLDQPAIASGAWDEAPLWFSSKRSPAPKNQAWPTPRAKTGYFRLGDENSWALIRAGRYSRRPFQADQLHVDLWWRGVNVARDAGTYLYNGDPPWDNSFGRTLVHNTVTLDGRDQMRRAGRFLWLDWAQAVGDYRAGSGGAHPSFSGEHDGYKRLGVTHRRTVYWLQDAAWLIVDDLLGSGNHDLRLHWLTPDLPLQLCDSPFQVEFTAANKQRIHWHIFSSCAGQHAIIRAGQSSNPEIGADDVKQLGWESPTYGELRPSVSLIYETAGRLPIRFTTVVLVNPDCGVQREENRLVVCRQSTPFFATSLLPEQTIQSREHRAPR